MDHHHYKKARIDPADRVAVYERYILDMLLQSDIKDEHHDSSVMFEIKHHHSTAQFARVLAKKRNLPIDVCTVGALMHDIYVAKYGSYKNHAQKSADLASSILEELGGFSEEEKQQILLVISNHSDKDIWSESPFEEFGKDVDILDSFLYPNAFGYYLKHKNIPVFYNYVIRAIKIWDELNIPHPRDFSIFDNYKDNWLNYKFELSESESESFICLICQLSKNESNLDLIPPTLLFKASGNVITFYINSDSYNTLKNAITSTSYIKNENISEEAKELIVSSRQAYILLWSAIDTYEVLEEPANSKRLNELGILRQEPTT
jgi:hypothetical protein